MTRRFCDKCGMMLVEADPRKQGISGNAAPQFSMQGLDPPSRDLCRGCHMALVKALWHWFGASQRLLIVEEVTGGNLRATYPAPDPSWEAGE